MGGFVGGVGDEPQVNPGSSVLGSIITGITNIANSGLFKTIRDNAKRKKAQQIANDGGYNTLSDYQKSLIGNVNPSIYGKKDPNAGNPIVVPGNWAAIGAVLILGSIFYLIYRHENG